MHDNDEWCGFGYLGERRHNFHKPELLEQADNLLLEFANDNAWTEAELFIFCNSTSGRYNGDVAFGSGDSYPADELRNDVIEEVAKEIDNIKFGETPHLFAAYIRGLKK
jgi:hypothetical protein